MMASAIEHPVNGAVRETLLRAVSTVGQSLHNTKADCWLR